MSERDDEYLWSGQGQAPDDLQRLETIFGGEKLRAPLRARTRRPVLLAVGLAALAAGAVFALGRQIAPPLSWVGAILPGVSGDELSGGVIELEVVAPQPPAGWQEAVEARMAEIGARGVHVSGRRVSVDFADDVPRELATGEAQQGTLEFKEVVEASDLMKALHARVEGGDPKAAELGVTAEIDGWDHDESGRRYIDYYLTARSEQSLRSYLDSAAAQGEHLRPPSGFELGFEKSEDQDGALHWRTYYLASRAWLSNRDVVNAHVYWNEHTNRPEVLVEFDRDGAQRFADFTGKMIGHKLAILLNGQITSAPVVQDRIAGGRSSITMGRGSAHEVQREAQDLVQVLRAGRWPLPVAMRQVSLQMRADRLSGAQIQAAQVALAALFGLLVFAGVWVVERRSPRIDPEVAPVRGRRRRRSLPWVRLLVSAVGVALALAAQRIPISNHPDLELLGVHLPMFALGIMPALSAYLLVELAALIVPRWRRLRSGGPSDRARLGAATAVVTILVALVQAWFIADFLVSVAPSANLSRWFLVLSLAGAAVVMALLALAIDKYGLGNGFAVLLFAGLIAQAHELGHEIARGEAGWPVSLSLFSAIAATAIATAWILRKRLRSASPASGIRLPTAGVVPLAALPALLTLLILVWPELAGRVVLWWNESVSEPTSGLLIELALLVAATLALSWLFSRPSRLGPATVSDAGRTHLRAFGLAAAVSTGYLVFIALLQRWLGAQAGIITVGMIAVVYATSIVMDLVAEWRAFARRDDLVPIWPLHQVQRVDLVTGALAKNDIDVHTRGLYLRLLLHFFGPFVPVLIYVPAAQAEEARAIIRAQLEAR